MQLNFTHQEIVSALSRLGVQTKNSNSSTIDVLCPFHDDKNFGNGKYFTDRGYYKCYSGKCGKVTNIIGFIKHIQGVKFKEAYQFVKGYAYSDNRPVDYSYRKKSSEIREEAKRTPRNRSVIINYLDLQSVKHNDYHYLRERGFDQEFIDKHQIKLCKSSDGRYYNYLIIPITDKNSNMNLFEARRVMLHEVYEDILGVKSNSTEDLEKSFRKQRFAKEMWQDWRFKYTLRPKTYYLKGFRINNTIFNLDNLDFSKPVYSTEGITGLPKVRRVFGENYTSTFGADLRPDQVKILSKFPKIIFIPDGDDASVTMIERASEMLPNVYVIPKTKKDTDAGYEKELRSLPEMEGTRYCIRRIGLLN